MSIREDILIYCFIIYLLNSFFFGKTVLSPSKADRAPNKIPATHLLPFA
jgi:hypothetical protein